jgi:hypothetical protein
MSTELQIKQASPLAMAAEFLKKDSNVDIDKLSKLLDIQERWEKIEAKKAFGGCSLALAFEFLLHHRRGRRLFLIVH